MPQPWSDDAIRHLLDSTTCPRCDVDALNDRRCLNCGADLRGEIATQLWTASQNAANALRARQQILDLVPVEKVKVAAAAPASTAVQDAVAVSSAPAAAGTTAAPQTERSSATVQSVLAVAGAGLFAVAAIVFTFFNPQLTDHALRSAIVGVVTLIFLGGAWVLARRGLQFSAEAVGALGMVFVALDVYAVSELAPAGVSGWVFTAIGTLVSAIVMIVVAAIARIRSWLFLALLGLAFVPAMVGYAGFDAGLGLWPTVLGHIGVGFGVLALLEAVRKLDPRFPGALTVDRVALTVLQVAAVATVVIQLPFAHSDSSGSYWLSVAGALAALSLLSFLSSRNLIAGFWSFVSGGFAVSAVAVLPFALDLATPWRYLALVPIAAGIAVIVLALVPVPASISRPLLTAGVLTMAAVATVTTVAFGFGVVLVRVAQLTQYLYGEDPFGVEGGISIVIGLAAGAVGLGVYTLLETRRQGGPNPGLRLAGTGAVSLLMLGALAFAVWTAWLPVVQIAVAIAVAVVISAVLLFVPFVRDSSLFLRVPAIIGAHVALVLAGILSWGDESFTVYAGIAIVAALILAARTIRTADHPIHWGVGYAYSLLLVARGLDLLDVLPTAAVFSLTTAVGAVVAIAATLIRRLRAPAWYAILIVTTVPFLIGVFVVIFDRTGWAALSSGLIFLLALTLMLTRRPGLNFALRAVAAGLLVPTLAVVITNLASQFLEQSGSPIALPVIAVIVAGVLPSAPLIRSALVAHGLPERDASLSRVFIEGSALLTAVIAVILALVLPAAGFFTAFIVLLVIGLGATASGIWGDRRYAWWVAFASFTGALWCIWALQHVTLIEPYLLPPALALAIIGVIVTARGGRGLPLYGTGLAVASVPVLGILAVAGSDGSTIPWRAYALLAAAWVLLLTGATIGRGPREWMTRLKVLSLPTLGIAIITGSAGAIQAVRFSVGADPLAADGFGQLLICLAIAAAGAVAAASSARAAIDDAPESALSRSRWMYAPAVFYVALSVVTLRPGHFDWPVIWTFWAIMFLLLAFMLVVVWRARTRKTTLPPAWFLFGLAFVIAVVGWSARDLWVETFSVPLGLMLLGAGVLAMRGVTDEAKPFVLTLNSWPIGARGSWGMLAPGIIVLFLASVLATSTNLMVWRAVGVIIAALLAILVGAQFKLAAPFILGIIVLPVENIVVFAVQITRGIDSIPWWITLAVVGAVLLIIAVTYERRSGEDGTITARLRDLK